MPSPTNSSTTVSPVPPSIHDYEFPADALIGEGTFGQVWLGFYKQDQPRAVKVFKPETLKKDRWRAEYEKLKALDEPPGIVTLYDQGETADGSPYVAMRLLADEKGDSCGCDGRTAMRRIELNDLDMETRWRLVFEIAETLAYMHRQGVYHCDVKPTNVLLSAGDEPRAVLCDFGQSIGEGYSPEGATGTFLYASPEQLRQNEAAIQSWDVYSFGVTAFQLLTGKLPRLGKIAEELKHEDAASVMERTAASFSPDSLSFGESLDRELIPLVMVEAIEAERELAMPESFQNSRKEEFDVLLRCLALEGDRPGRYEGMPEVVEAFEEVSRRQMIAAERRKKLIYATLMVFGLVAAALAGWQWKQAKEYGEQAQNSAIEQRRLAELAATERDEAQFQKANAEKQTEIAKSEKEKAIESEKVALLARSTAESLINSILYDLKDRLEPLGRVDLLDQVSGNAEAYFAELPESHRDDLSERERSTMLNNRGDVFMALADWDGAMKSFEEALEIRRKLLNASPDDPDRLRDLSVSRERVGDVLAIRGDVAGAEAIYREILAIRENLAVEGPVNRDVSVALSKLSDVLARQARFEDAIRFAVASVDSFRQGTNETPGEKRRSARDLSAAQMRCGDLHRQMEQPGEALICYRESAESLEELLKKAAADDAEVRRDFGAVLVRLGDWHLEAEAPDEALKNYQRALPIVRQSMLRDPENPEAQRNLALLLSRMGEIRLAAGDFPAAEELYRESAELFENLMTHPEPQPVWLEDAQAALIGWGNTVAALSLWEEAHQHYSISLNLARRRLAITPGGADLETNLVVSLFKTATALRELGGEAQVGEARTRLEEALEFLASSKDREDGWIDIIQGELKKLDVE